MKLVSTENASGADNQQETSKEFFYYTGFCCGEMSVSLLKLKNRKSKTNGVYYTPDITVSHSDKSFLKEINQLMTDGVGVISKIKGGYNLSFRGKRKVIKALSFFSKYPPIVGDISVSKLNLIDQSIKILKVDKSYRRTKFKTQKLEKIRERFKKIKKTAVPISIYKQAIFDKDAIGYFLSGVFDAEGSLGLKKSGRYYQPFFAVAMRDKKIIKLFKDFLKLGNIHKRPKEKILHYEIGSRKEVLSTLNVFLNDYPFKLVKTNKKAINLRRILNDYTPGSLKIREKI